MARLTVKEKVANLSSNIKGQLSQAAQNGESIVSLSERFRLEYPVVSAYLWQAGTLPWQGAKAIIARRLRSLRTASRREHREQLTEDVREQVNYLYYAARQLQDQLERIKRLAK